MLGLDRGGRVSSRDAAFVAPRPRQVSKNDSRFGERHSLSKVITEPLDHVAKVLGALPISSAAPEERPARSRTFGVFVVFSDGMKEMRKGNLDNNGHNPQSNSTSRTFGVFSGFY
jgi:hypothetical protein